MNLCPRALAVQFFVLAFALLLSGCRGEKLQDLEAKLNEQKPKSNMFATEKSYPIVFPELSPSLTGGVVRVLAPLGTLDKFEPVDTFDPEFKLQRGQYLFFREGAESYLQVNPGYYQRTGTGTFELDSDGTYVKLEDGRFIPRPRDLYLYQKAPRLLKFEERYGIDVQLTRSERGEPVFQSLKSRGLQGSVFDLILSRRHLIEPLRHKDGLQMFNRENLSHLDEVQKSLAELFPPIPEDPNLRYCIPYYWSALGIFFHQGRVVAPPKDWSDFFNSERYPSLWGTVSYIDRKAITLGMGLIFLNALDPVSRAHMLTNVQELLQMSADVQKIPDEGQRTAELEKLLRAYVSMRYSGARSPSEQFGIHGESFQSRSTNEMAAQNLRQFLAATTPRHQTPDGSFQLWTQEQLNQVVQLTRKAVLFGANFRNESDATKLATGEAFMTIGDASDYFSGWLTNHDVHFVIPETGTFLQTWVFVLPSGMSPVRKTRAEFLLNYLLMPEVMADMTEFSMLANSSKKSRLFTNRIIFNTPIYSFPPPHAAFHLPIFDDAAGMVDASWQQIKQFHNDWRDLGWNPRLRNIGKN